MSNNIINDIDRNYGALLACIFNDKLGRREALRRVGIIEKFDGRKYVNRRAIQDTEAAKIKYMYEVEKYKVKEIAAKYNVALRTITLFMQRNHIQGRGRGIRVERVAL